MPRLSLLPRPRSALPARVGQSDLCGGRHGVRIETSSCQCQPARRLIDESHRSHELQPCLDSLRPVDHGGLLEAHRRAINLRIHCAPRAHLPAPSRGDAHDRPCTLDDLSARRVTDVSTARQAGTEGRGLAQRGDRPLEPNPADRIRAQRAELLSVDRLRCTSAENSVSAHDAEACFD